MPPRTVCDSTNVSAASALLYFTTNRWISFDQNRKNGVIRVISSNDRLYLIGMTKLLFANTFCHDTVEELNIDYVKFSSGALATLREIRIIPGGARIPIAEAPQRQGLTSPNSFSLEVFAKNCKRSDASVFERIAMFDYHFDSDIRFQIPAFTTDGVLFKGKYTALTVAIYGDPVSGDETAQSLLAVSTVASVPGTTSATTALQQTPATAFPSVPPDGGGSLLAVPANVIFAAQQPAQIVTVGTPIPTWVAPPPPVLHMTPPPTYNPLIPPPAALTVISSYQAATTAPGSGNVFVGTSAAHSSGGVLLPIPFDPTRPPPTFHTPQHSPQLVSQQSQQISPTEKRSIPHTSRRHEPSTRSKRQRSSESARKQPGEGKHVESVAATKLVTSITPSQQLQAAPLEEIQAEEGEFTQSEGDGSEKFDLENISEEEFEFDDSMAAEVNDTELQEDLLVNVRFNPYQFSIAPFKFFKSPSLSVCEETMVEYGRGKLTMDLPNLAMELLPALEICERNVYNDGWIVAMEKLVSLVEVSILYVIREMHQPDVVERLISCVLGGLDKEKALQQQTISIVRHQKAGIRLTASLFRSDQSVASKLCDAKLQHRLLDLMEDEIISTPIILQIIRALDASLVFEIGLRSMLYQKVESIGGRSLTPYERLTRFIFRERSARVMVAIHHLMQKVVLHHSLKGVFVAAEKIASAASNGAVNEDDDQKSEQSSTGEPVLQEEDIVALCENLTRVTELYRNANHVLTQASFSLPTTAVFSCPQRTNDPYPAIYGMFNRNHLLPSLYLLLTHWSTGSEPRIVTLIHQLLVTLMSTPSGLPYFASMRDVVQEILQFLLQKDDSSEDNGGSLMQDFGLDLAHHLQASQYVDELLHLHKGGALRRDIDNPDAMKLLQALYVLSLDQSGDRKGTRAVARVLSWHYHLASILPFIELTGDTELDNKIKKSACAGYAAELLLLVLRHSESIDYLKTFQERLLMISSQEITSKIAEVKQWVEPLRKLPAFTVDSVEYLVEKIKGFVLTEGVSPRTPKGLITALRLLQQIAVEPQRIDDIEKPCELRYKYALVQFHCYDGLSTLVQLIDKLADSQTLNWQQGISLNNKHGHIFYACVVPAVTIIRASLCYLIHCRGSEFSDLTSIEPLLKLYTVSCTLASSFGITPETQRVQNEVVAALLAFTQPEAAAERIPGKSAETLKENEKNLWTKMIMAILKFSLDAPLHFVSGINIFSELLPLPLPMPTREPLSQEETLIVQAHRRLWTLQLVPIADQIQAMIRDFAQSTQHTLQQGLRRLCLQLADLSFSMSNTVVKAVLDSALENCEFVEKRANPKEPDETPIVVRREVILPATAQFGRVLNLLSYMSSQASFKTAFLGLLKQRKEKQGDDCGRLLQYMLTILCHPPVERSHGVCQELIVSTLQSLCDEEIGIGAPDPSGSTNDQLSCIPDFDQIREICCALLKHVGDASQTYATILPALRIFVMLCEHDYGLDFTKRAMESDQESVLALLERLLDEFSGHSSDCISTLSTLLMLLRSLQATDEHAPSRKRTVGTPFVRKILKWKGDSTNEDHCLMKFKQLLADAMEEESSVCSLYDDVINIISILSVESVLDEKADEDEPMQQPFVVDVQRQFNSRPVWMISTEAAEDRLQPHYWFPAEILEEDDDQNAERMSYELGNLKAQYLPEFDLEKELAAKILAKRVEESESKRKAAPGRIINTSRGERKHFIAPLRGRGVIPRGSVSMRINDPFRNRMPNTSRPPSMHVDDFILAQRHVGADQGVGDINRSAGKASPRDGSRAGSSRAGERIGAGRSSRYCSPMDGKGRSFPKTDTLSGATAGYQPRGSMFDRPRERYDRGGGSHRHGGRSSRSFSSHKSPRHRASSK